MKQTIKMIAVLIVVPFAFSVYPMEKHNCYSAEIDGLKQKNPLSGMNNFNIEIDNNADCRSTSKDDPIHKDRGLALSLTAVSLFAESNEIKNKETLKTIRTTVREEIPITSNYYFKSLYCCFSVFIFPNKSPTAIFTFIENFFKCPPLLYANNDHVNKKRL